MDNFLELKDKFGHMVEKCYFQDGKINVVFIKDEFVDAVIPFEMKKKIIVDYVGKHFKELNGLLTFPLPEVK